MKNGKIVDKNGTQYYKNGVLHRTDGPAVEWPDGTKFWYINGLRHRIGAPAVEFLDGTKSWYINDKRHREDGPAVEWPGGLKFYYLNNRPLPEADYIVEIRKIKLQKIKELLKCETEK